MTAPVYRLDGALVATSEADLWNGGVNVPVNIAAEGSTTSVLTWTGTHANNGRAIAGRQLGTSEPFAGNPSETNVSWTTWGAIWSSSTLYRMYALSEQLTVVPEPASLVLLGIAPAGLGVFLVRRRNTTRRRNVDATAAY